MTARRGMGQVLAAFALAGLLCLTACGRREVLHLGLNAVVTEVDAENQVLYVRDPADEALFGERCAIDCGTADLLYCDYATGEVRTIGFDTLEAGDDVILELSESELARAADGLAAARQVQLGTQRLG